MPRKRHILIVDDDSSVLCSYKMILESNTNHVVELASDGEEALQKLDQGHFDQMLLDLMMPRLTGFDVLMKLRSSGRFCPAIITSGYGDGSTLLYALFHGVADFLVKPVSAQDLLSTLDNVLYRQERYSQMNLSDICHFSSDELLSFSLYCIQHRNFSHAQLSLTLLNARNNHKSSNLLLGMLAEVQRNFDESQDHYLRAASLQL